MGGPAARGPASPWTGRAGGWLRGTRGGFLLVAALLGAGAGLGAVAFRYLVYGFTWLATGHTEFGQQGYVGSSHLPWLGLGFFVVIPVVGGIIYGTGVLEAVARQIRTGDTGAPQARLAADSAWPDAVEARREPPAPLAGYRLVEIAIGDGSPAAGQALGALAWPPGWTPVSVLRDHRLGSPDPGTTLSPGDRINVLVPLADHRDQPGPA